MQVYDVKFNFPSDMLVKFAVKIFTNLLTSHHAQICLLYRKLCRIAFSMFVQYETH